MTELFGNMTTKQAGLLGTRAVFQSQWGIVACAPMSLDVPLLQPYFPRLVSYYAIRLSFLPVFSSLDTSFHPLRSDRQVVFKEKKSNEACDPLGGKYYVV